MPLDRLHDDDRIIVQRTSHSTQDAKEALYLVEITMGFNEFTQDYIYKENMPGKIKGFAYDQAQKVVLALAKNGS